MPQHDAPHTDPAANGDERGASPRRLRRGLKYAAYGLGGLIALVVVLVLAFLLLLQTNWGSARVSRALVGLANPFDAAQLTIGEVDGNWVSNLTLRDVNLFRLDSTAALPDTIRMAHVDSVRLRYALPALLRGTIHVREASAFGPQVAARQQPDSTWDLLQPFATEAPQDTAQAAFTFRVDQLRVEDGRATAAFYNPRRDSTLHVRGLHVRAEGLLIGPDSTTLDLEQLSARFTPPAQELERRFEASAALAGQRLAVRQLQLESPYSDLRAEGTLRLPEDSADTVDDVDFRLTAQPLSFRDLAGFVAGIDTSRSLTLDARAAGTGRELRATLEAQFSDGARIDLTAEGTPDASGPVRYQLDGHVRSLDPGFFTTDTETGRINADLSADLEGPSLHRISGTAAVELFDTRVAGYAPDRTRLAATFTDGTARLDARTGLRGATLTAGGTVRPFADTLVYDLRARFADLDLARAVQDTTLSGALAGTLTLEGRGTDPAAATMEAALALDSSSTLNRYRLAEGGLTARLSGGRLAVDARLRSPQQGSLTASAAVENLGTDVLRYRLDPLRLDALDIAALAGDTTRSRLTGTLALRGSGTDPQTMQVAPIRVQLTDGRYGTYQIEAADLSAALIDGRLRAEGLLALAEAGTFELTATARPFADPLTYAVSEGRFRNVDIGALAQDTSQHSDLSGTFSLRGAGTDPQAMRLAADLRLDPSQLNRQAIDAAALEAELQDGALAVDLRLDVPGGSTRLAGSGRPFDAQPTFALSDGQIRNLNIGALAALPGLETDLNASLALRLNAPASAAPDAAAPDPSVPDAAAPDTSAGGAVLYAALDLPASRINQARLESGRLHVRQEADSTYRAEGLLDFAEGGRAHVDGFVRLGAEPPTYALTAGLQRLDVAALLAADSLAADTLATRLSLQAEVQGAGFDPQTMSVTGRITSDSLAYADVHVREMAVDFALESGLLRVDTLLLRSNLATLTGSGPVALYDGASAPSDLTLHADLHGLQPLQSLLGAELLALDGGTLDAAVTGPAGRLRLDARADLRSLVYNDIRLAGFETRLSGTLDDSLALQRASVDGSLASLALPSFAAQNVDYQVGYADQMLDVTTSLLIDEERRARLAATADLRPDRQRIALTEASLRLGEDQWQLLQEATVTYGDAYRVSGLLLYSGAQQIALDGVIDLDGRQSLAMTIENVEVAPVTGLLEFEGLGGTLNGALSLTGRAAAPQMTGTLRYDIYSDGRPAGDLRLALDYDSLRMNVDAQLTHREGSALVAEGYVPLDLRLQAPDTATASDAAAASDTSGAAGGVLPGQQPIDLAVRADSFAIGWLRPFLDPATVDAIDGELTARLAVTGTPEAPILEGDAFLRSGRLGLPALGLTYTDIDAAIGFADDQVQLQQITLDGGQGTLRAEGTINLPDLTLGEYDIQLEARQFQAINTSDFQAEADASLQLSGTTERPQLEGAVDLLSGDFYIGAAGGPDVEEVPLTEEDLRTLQRRFGVSISEADTTTADTYAALAMELDLSIQRDVWLRSRTNPEMAIQFTGDLDVQKPPYEELQLFGSIEVIPTRSYVNQFGKRFNITDGMLTFNGPPADPVLDVAASYEVSARRDRSSQVTIDLGVEGRLDDLDLTLSSTPQMETTDILSYIATGRPASETFLGSGSSGTARNGTGTQTAGQTAGQAAAGFALGQAAGFFENLGAAEAGLDVVEIEIDQLRGAVLTAGKYYDIDGLPRPLYVGVSQPIGTTTTTADNTSSESAPTQITLEYELTDWLLLRLLRQNALRVNLLWEYAY